MLTLTTPDGQTVTAPDEIALAAEFGEQVDGIDWDDLCPFDDHTLTWQYVGHHSEGRHRRAVARADSSARRGIDAQHDADRAAERAETASHTTAARYNPVTVANRIDKFGADIRRIEREIVADRYDPETGYQPASDELKAARAKRAAPRLAELRDKLEYWEGVRADQIANGTATGYTREQIQKGDLVKIRGHWREVVRANLKTVSVTTGYSWTDTAPYAEIQEHKRP